MLEYNVLHVPRSERIHYMELKAFSPATPLSFSTPRIHYMELKVKGGRQARPKFVVYRNPLHGVEREYHFSVVGVALYRRIHYMELKDSVRVSVA